MWHLWGLGSCPSSAGVLGGTTCPPQVTALARTGIFPAPGQVGGGVLVQFEACAWMISSCPSLAVCLRLLP